MSFTPGKNTLEFTTPYYVFEARDPAYRNIRFFPKIFVTRIDDKNVKIIVQLAYYAFGNKTANLAGTFEYNEAVDKQEEYFRKLQNSNFSFGLPRPLVFLEKVIAAIQQFISSSGKATKATASVAINAVPTTVLPVPISYTNTFIGTRSAFLFHFYLCFQNRALGKYTVTDGTATVETLDGISANLIPNENTSPSKTNFTYTPSDGSQPIDGFVDWTKQEINPYPPGRPYFTCTIQDQRTVSLTIYSQKAPLEPGLKLQGTIEIEQEDSNVIVVSQDQSTIILRYTGTIEDGGIIGQVFLSFTDESTKVKYIDFAVLFEWDNSINVTQILNEYLSIA